MNLMSRISSARQKKKALLMALVLSAMIGARPAPALAQCENGFVAIGLAAAAAAEGLVGVWAAYGLQYAAILGFITERIYQPTMNDLDDFEDSLINRMNQWWKDWQQALKDETKQLSASMINQSREIGTGVDGGVYAAFDRALASAQYEAVKQYEPTEEGCKFDTAARYNATATRTSKAMESGLSGDMSQIAGSNSTLSGTNSPYKSSFRSAGDFQKTRWDLYVKHFCDPAANGGHAGCTTAGDNVDAHIMPSRTLFGKETVDLAADEKSRVAVNELIFNLTNYTPPPTMAPATIDKPAGLEQRRTNREYLAQMDMAGSMLYGIVGERTASLAAPEVKAARVRMGITDASDKPSEREIRTSTIEQLWDPNYFVNLSGGKSTVAQKEVYLQAYNTSLLYKIIERSEKIANIYAVEGANMLEQRNGTARSSGIEYGPVR